MSSASKPNESESDEVAELSDDSIELVAPEPTNRRLGRYELRYELATGGMATVYLGRAEGPGGFDKLVAVKCILPHLAKDPRFVEMFLDEARIAARINHPNVCGVFDFGMADGTYFIAMAYLVGEPLNRVKRAVLAAPEAARDPHYPAICARIVADACEGLHAAHELRDETGKPLDVVHRDVSPQNVFVTYDGTVSVVDFGVAHAAGRVHHTKTGVLKGKLAYMPPEQLHRQKLDRRGDVWALGVVLWEMLTLERLFRRDTEIDTILAVERGEIAAPSTVRAGIPEALDAIVLRALSRDREGRYATARELGRALNQFIASRGEAIGMPELAEWMATLLPKDRADRLALAQRTMRPSGVNTGDHHAVLPDADLGDRTVSDSKIVERSQSPGTPVDPPIPALQAQPATEVGRRRWIPLAITGVVVAAAAVAIAFVVDGGEPPATPSDPVSPPTVATPAPPEDQAAPPDPAPHTPEATPDPIVEPTNVEPAGIVEPANDPRPTSKRPRPRPTPPPPSTATGVVNVVTPSGWADIYVGGRQVGRTPARLTLPAGPTTIEIRPYGTGARLRRRVVVSPTAPARLAVDIPER